MKKQFVGGTNKNTVMNVDQAITQVESKTSVLLTYQQRLWKLISETEEREMSTCAESNVEGQSTKIPGGI